jgi:hypothetical protein
MSGFYTSHTKYWGVVQSRSENVDALTLLLDSVSAMQPSVAVCPLAQFMGSLLDEPFFEHQDTALLLSCIPEVHKLKPEVTGYPTKNDK